MKLPKFLNPKKKSEPGIKQKRINTAPDEERVKREVTYENRLLKGNSRVNRLQERANLNNRRGHGRK